jgi:hypothetical protein
MPTFTFCNDWGGCWFRILCCMNANIPNTKYTVIFTRLSVFQRLSLISGGTHRAHDEYRLHKSKTLFGLCRLLASRDGSGACELLR